MLADHHPFQRADPRKFVVGLNYSNDDRRRVGTIPHTQRDAQVAICGDQVVNAVESDGCAIGDDHDREGTISSDIPTRGKVVQWTFGFCDHQQSVEMISNFLFLYDILIGGKEC